MLFSESNKTGLHYFILFVFVRNFRTCLWKPSNVPLGNCHVTDQICTKLNPTVIGEWKGNQDGRRGSHSNARARGAASTHGSAPRRPSWPADVTIGAAPRGLALNQLFIAERGEEDFRLFRRKPTEGGVLLLMPFHSIVEDD